MTLLWDKYKEPENIRSSYINSQDDGQRKLFKAQIEFVTGEISVLRLIQSEHRLKNWITSGLITAASSFIGATLAFISKLM